MRTTKDQRAWLSRNWTPSDTSFRAWVAGSTRAHSIVSHLIEDVEDSVEVLKKIRDSWPDDEERMIWTHEDWRALASNTRALAVSALKEAK